MLQKSASHSNVLLACLAAKHSRVGKHRSRGFLLAQAVRSTPTVPENSCKSRTAAAAPAEPGELPWTLACHRLPRRDKLARSNSIKRGCPVQGSHPTGNCSVDSITFHKRRSDERGHCKTAGVEYGALVCAQHLYRVCSRRRGAILQSGFVPPCLPTKACPRQRAQPARRGAKKPQTTSTMIAPTVAPMNPALCPA